MAVCALPLFGSSLGGEGWMWNEKNGMIVMAGNSSDAILPPTYLPTYIYGSNEEWMTSAIWVKTL